MTERDGGDQLQVRRGGIDFSLPPTEPIDVMGYEVQVPRWLAERLRQAESSERTMAERDEVDQVEAFNEQRPVGTPVRAYPGTRDDEPLVTRTRTPAWLIGGHTPAVSVYGHGGGIALTHIDVRDEGDCFDYPEVPRG